MNSTRKQLITIIIAVIAPLGAFSSCSNNNVKPYDGSGDTTKIEIIKKILADSIHDFTDYEVLFSGTDPLVMEAVNVFKSDTSEVNAKRLLVLEKLYRSAEEMSNRLLLTKEAKTQADSIISWPIFRWGSEPHKKWRNAISEAAKKIY
ncbi:MAG TPA: hypothetical protein PKW80_01095 [Bacteroidales bacterium]|nr:hypothetical protein [Bacteroidales bacterium]